MKQSDGPDSTQSGQDAGPQPTRIIEFANFFKRYMSISSLIVAALPVPVTALGLIPVYSAQKGFLGTYTSLFCFLTLGFVFFIRHALARWLFPDLLTGILTDKMSVIRPSSLRIMYRVLGRGVRRLFVAVLPLLLIVASFVFVFKYHEYLGYSLGDTPNSDQILRQTPFNTIPDGDVLMLLYLGVFIAAEGAFILMAIQEYIQDLLGITDISLMTHFRAASKGDLKELVKDRSALKLHDTGEG